MNTMALLGIDPVWVMPEPNAGEGLAGRITPEGVRKALEKNPEAKGVYLTSPDYYGVICDIQGIACVCKEYGVPLLVDNAHGAIWLFIGKSSSHPFGSLYGRLLGA